MAAGRNVNASTESEGETEPGHFEQEKDHLRQIQELNLKQGATFVIWTYYIIYIYLIIGMYDLYRDMRFLSYCTALN